MKKINRRLASAGVGIALALGSVTAALPAEASYWSHIYPIKGNGPGIKNWHCVDTAKHWHGPWRVFKGSAQADCMDYIAGSGQA